MEDLHKTLIEMQKKINELEREISKNVTKNIEKAKRTVKVNGVKASARIRSSFSNMFADDEPQSDKAKRIISIAPHLDEESLHEVVEEFLSGELEINMLKIAPYLNDDDLKLLAEKVCASENGEYKGLTLTKLMPYLDEETIGEMFINGLDNGVFDEKFLPYLDDEALHEVAERFCDGKLNIDITSLYPYFDEEDIDMIVKYYIKNGEAVDESLYPFLEDDTLHELVMEFCNNPNSNIDIDSLYPFLDEDDLNILFRAYMKKK